MSFFKIKRQSPLVGTLQKAYEEAHHASVHAIVLETRNEYTEALHAWRSTLRKISLSLATVTDTPQSRQEVDLMTNIMNIEKQCHDRIASLERGWTGKYQYPPHQSYPNEIFSDSSNSSYAHSQKSPSLASPKVSMDSTYYDAIGSPSHTSEFLDHHDLHTKHYVPKKSSPDSSSTSTLTHPVARASSNAGSKDSNFQNTRKNIEAQKSQLLHSSKSHSRTTSASSSRPNKLASSTPVLSPVSHHTSTPPKAASTSLLFSNKHKKSLSSPGISVSSNLSVDQQFAALKLESVRSLSPSKEPQELRKVTPRVMVTTLRSSQKIPKKIFDERKAASDAAHLAWTPSPRTYSPASVSSKSSNNTAKAKPAASAKQPPARSKPARTPVTHTPLVKSAAPLKKQTTPSSAVATRSTKKLVSNSKTLAPSYKATKGTTEKKTLTGSLAKNAGGKQVKQIGSNTRYGNNASAKPKSSLITNTSRNVSPNQNSIPDLSEKQDTSSSTATSDLSDNISDNDDLTEEEAWHKRACAIVKKIKGIDQNAADSIFNDVVVKGDPVVWNDIAGLEQAKSSLKEAVVYPFLRPDLFSGLREPAQGMLLFGPPGTGKTMLARAVATESKSTFFSISASSLTSKFLGESEKLVRALFLMAKALAPSIIFVDEIDSLLSARSDTGENEASRRIKTEFLIQWSALQHAAAGKEHDDVTRVLVLGATNLPWVIDEAARRRFVRRQYIPLPEVETRRHHLVKLLSRQKHSLSESQLGRLVVLTDGFSGSDLTALAKDAAMGPLRALGDALLTTPTDQIRPLGFEDFVAALKTIRPSVSKESLKVFEDWAEMYGSSGA